MTHNPAISKQEMKELNAIWQLADRKRILTVAKNNLLQCELKDHPDVKKVIDLLSVTRKSLDKLNPLEL